jgi:hypothetical protein
MAATLSSHGALVTGAGGSPMLCLLGEGGAFLSTQNYVELLGGVLYLGLQRGWWPATG